MAAWLDQKARQVAADPLNRLMEAERDAFLGCQHYQRPDLRRGCRNGHEERRLDTTLGPLQPRLPWVRNTDEPFRTTAVQTCRRCWPRIEAAIRCRVVGGLSIRATAAEVTRTFGVAVSATTASRIVAELDSEIQAFHRRRLGPGRYRYVFLDGKHLWTCRRRRRRGRGKKRKAVVLLAWGYSA